VRAVARRHWSLVTTAVLLVGGACSRTAPTGASKWLLVVQDDSASSSAGTSAMWLDTSSIVRMAPGRISIWTRQDNVQTRRTFVNHVGVDCELMRWYDDISIEYDSAGSFTKRVDDYQHKAAPIPDAERTWVPIDPLHPGWVGEVAQAACARWSGK
jgi:hypothetical protein